MDRLDTDKYRGWLTKKQAAERLHRSPKTVQRLAAANRIGSVALRDPHAPGGEIWLYDPADVDRMAPEVRQRVRPTLSPSGPASNGNGHGPGHAIAARPAEGASAELSSVPVVQIAAIAAAVSRQMAMLSMVSIQWLTLREAAAETHLSETYLRRLIAEQKLSAVKDRGWRIRRRDLEQL
jgi:excisionase family DNA binding protein